MDNNLTFTIKKPLDMHLHLREGDVMKAVIPYSANPCIGAVIMPNITTPIVNREILLQYRESILSNLSKDSNFTPLFTYYLNDDISNKELELSLKNHEAFACKLYPKGATTGSAFGVSGNLKSVYPTLEFMEKIGMPLLIHGEYPGDEYDIFDREGAFIDFVLLDIIHNFPNLKISLEHITTSYGIQLVESSTPNIVGTITPHHLVINRNHILSNKVNPHMFCLPVAKREEHRKSLVRAVTKGCSGKLFAGTDSAPHDITHKECNYGCAGVFNAESAWGIYAQIFEDHNALDRLEDFVRNNPESFYNLNLNNSETLTITKYNHKQSYNDIKYSSNGYIKAFESPSDIFWNYK